MPKRKTTEEFKKEVEILFNGEYKVIGDYKNNKTKIKMLHLKCNKEYESSNPHDILRKKGGCPWCAGRVTTLDRLKELLPNNFVYISGFIDWKSKCKFKCLTCNREFLQAPTYIVNGRGCPWCAGTKNYTHSEFIEILNEKFDDINDYEFLDKYKNTTTKLKIKHLKCNNVFLKDPEHFLRGQRCPYCNGLSSVGELLIEKFLNKNNIYYEKEKQFKDFISKNYQPYKYDFYLKDFNLIIEFDGEQHFKPWKNNLDRSSLRINIDNDKLKNIYIIENNLSLLRIHYSELANIKNILYNFLINGKRSETIENFKLLYINNILIKDNNNYYSEIKEVE